MTKVANNGREPSGRFAKGNPGGPGGPRRRACELRRAAEDAVTTEHIQAIVRKAARMALEGNLAAMRLVLERTCGRAAEAPTEIEPLAISLPRLRTPTDCSLALEMLVQGIVDGTVNRDAAGLLIDAVKTRLRSIEAQDLEERITQLEESARLVSNRFPKARGRR